jgi:hypothetical protein
LTLFWETQRKDPIRKWDMRPVKPLKKENLPRVMKEPEQEPL